MFAFEITQLRPTTKKGTQSEELQRDMDDKTVFDGIKERLRQSIKASGKTMRSISIDAGQAETYVSNLLREEKVPTVVHLLRVCEATGADPMHVILGDRSQPTRSSSINDSEERLLSLFSRLDEPEKAIVLRIMRGLLEFR